MKNILLLSFGLFLLTACEEVFEKTIDYEIPEEPSKLVIDAKLEAGQQASVFTSTSVYSMGSQNPVMDTNTQLNLYENGTLIESLTPLGSGYYEGQYVIKASHGYKVEATRKGYKTAFGEDIVREPVEITQASFFTEKEGYRLIINFNDPPGPGDYYYFYTSLIANGTSRQKIYFQTLDPTVEIFTSFDDPFSKEQGKFGEDGYLSDQYFDGRGKRLELNSAGYFYQGPIDTSFTIQFNLFRISKNLYQHEKTKAAYNLTQGGLFTEPVQVYTNIINGYGIVAGAARSSVDIKP